MNMQPGLRHAQSRHGRIARKMNGRRVVPLAGAFGGMLMGFAMLGGTAVAAVIGYFAADLPAAHELSTAPVALSTYIYDRTGEHLLYTLEEQRRELISLPEVPQRMQQATVAIEDKSFWSNPGIDVGGMIRAFGSNVKAGGITQGGSTITQQLIKTRLLGDEPTYTRKIKEAILAVEATREYSKAQILEMYFDQIYYGNQSYGIRSAAKTYFGAYDLNTLTLGQMALLAGLPQAPSEYDPIQRPEGAAARRRVVLDAMVDQGYVTKAEADAAADERIEVKSVSTSLAAPHFTFRAREQLIGVMGEKAAYRGGYRVYTSLDWNMQQLAEKEVKEHVDSLQFANVHNAALITMDPTTGEVLAYVGSKDYYDRSKQVQGDYDSAGIALRQPGSTFKLFTYLTGMQKAGLTASSVLQDIAFTTPDGSGQVYKPKDATGEEHGPVTLRQALRESLNLPALNVSRMVGVDAIIDTIHQLGIDRDFGDRTRLGLSFGIGAGEMRLLDMASAYQTIANMGMRVEPTFILRIEDGTGKVVKDYSKPEGRRVLDQRLAWVFTDILKDNTNPQGSFVFGPWTTIGRPAALKTGTTDNLQDVLAIGYVPQRLTAIWMGNADNSEMRGISSALGPGVLWRDYMKGVVGALPVADWPRPAGVVDKVVCVNPSLTGGNGSGKIPGPFCPSNFRFTEKYVQGTEPTTDDRDFYAGCGIQLRSPFADWQKDVNRWASEAIAGKHSYGRFNWTLCGFGAQCVQSPGPSANPPSTAANPASASGSPSACPSASGSPSGSPFPSGSPASTGSGAPAASPPPTPVQSSPPPPPRPTPTKKP